MMKVSKNYNLIRIALILFFIFAAALPLLAMFMNLLNPESRYVFTDPRFFEACINSILVSVTATAISLAIAFVMSWILCRTNIKGKSLIAIILTLPMLIPSLAHGMGLVFLLGSNGLLTSIFSIEIPLYGFVGIVIGSVLYSFPSTFLLVYDVMKYEDSTQYEAARILGIPKLHQIKSITLPYLKKPLISAIFVTFALIVTDYGVPLMVGGKTTTLPVLMYQEVIGMLNFNTGVAVGFVLLIPAVIAFVIDVINADKGKSSYVSKPFHLEDNKVRDLFGYVVSVIVSLCVFMPIAAFILVSFVQKYPIDLSFTFNNIGRSLDLGLEDYLFNSILIAVGVSAIGTVLAYLAGYISARMPGKFARIVHLSCITTMAIPGIVLGLSYVLFFKGSFIYGTFFILIMVNLVHFFASPYLMAFNAFGKVNKNLEYVGLTLGIGRKDILKDVLIPQTLDTIIEMFVYFFVNCMVTISAVAFLSTTITMPLALLITDLDAQRLTECAAFVSLVILIANVFVKFIAYLAKKLVAKYIYGN